MKDFFEAHRERMERNHDEFIKMAAELKEIGCRVFGSKDGYISMLKIFRGDRHVVFGFTEVPYRWYLQKCLNPQDGNGSGRTIKEICSDSGNPFTTEDILSAMSENPNNKNFTKPSYLKELSFDVISKENL